ncbi:MAG TPA: M23 family metallopeptidase [bacterium]|nr:M23 family metallopeptidase [bacterium]
MNAFREGLTVMVIPRGSSRVWRVGLSRGVVWGLAVILAVVGLAAAGYAVRTAVARLEALSYARLQDGYLAQQVELRGLAERVGDLQAELGRMRVLDYQLRLMTNLGSDRASPIALGVGGGGEEAASASALAPEDAGLPLVPRLTRSLDTLGREVRYQEESFNNLKSYLLDQKDLIERTPYRWPLTGHISSPFGVRMDPISGERGLHPGIDIAAPVGTVIRAPANGIVTFSGRDPDLGNMLVIDHGYGVITRYGHMLKSLVGVGQRVSRGDPVGEVGNTGYSTGPHLHYEVRVNDAATNPQTFIVP